MATASPFYKCRNALLKADSNHPFVSLSEMPPYSYPSNLLPPETPSTVKRTQDPLFQTAPHPQRREAVCSDARPSTFEVSTEFFLDKVAPILRPDIDIPRVMENLKRDGTIVENRFKKFSKDPSEMYGGEDTVFRKTFQVVVRKIIEAGKPRGIQSTLQFFHNGKAVPASDVRSNKTRPDSYGILRTAKGVRWIYIGLTGEVKLGDTDGKRLDVSVKQAESSFVFISHYRTTKRRCGTCTIFCARMLREGSPSALRSKTLR